LKQLSNTRWILTRIEKELDVTKWLAFFLMRKFQKEAIERSRYAALWGFNKMISRGRVIIYLLGCECTAEFLSKMALSEIDL